MTADQPQPGTTQAPRKRRLGLWIVIGVGALVVVGLLVVLAIPTLLGGPLKGTVVSAINDRIAGRVQIDDLSLSWFGGQHIGGLVVLDPQGQPVATVRRVDLPEASLFALARGNLNLGPVAVEVQEANLVQRPDGSMNLTEAIKSTSPDTTTSNEPARWPDGLSVQLDVQADRVSYAAPEMETVVLTGTKLGLDARDPRQIAAQLNTQLQQGASTGQVTADVKAADVFAANNDLQLAQANVQADANVNNMPGAAIDRLLQQQGKLEALLGQKVSARIQASGKLSDLKATFTANSPTLQATIKAAAQGDTLVVGDSSLKLTVTPQAWSQWVAARQNGGANAAPAMTLTAPFEVNLAIERLALPAQNAANLSTVSAQITGEISDIVLDTHDPAIGQVAMRRTALSVSAKNLRDGLDAQLGSTPVQGGREGSLGAKATVTNLLDAAGALALDRAKAHVNLEAAGLPVALVDQIAAQEGLLLAALGDTLNTTVVADVQRGADGAMQNLTATLTAQSRHLDANVQARLDGNAIVVSDSLVKWTLTPPAFARLTAAEGQPYATLQKPAEMRLRINRVTAPEQGGNLATLAADLRLEMDELLLNTPDVGAVALRGTQADLNTKKLADGATLTLNATPVLNNQQGQLQATVNARNLVDGAGAIAPQQAAAEVDASFAGLPTALVDQLAGQGGLLVDALGPTLDARRITANVSRDSAGKLVGPFTVQAAGPNAQVELAGQMQPDKIVVNEKSRLALRLTPPLMQRAIATYVKPVEGDLLHGLALRGPAQVAVEVNSLTAPQPFDLARTVAGLTVTVQSLQLQGEPRLNGVDVNQLVLTTDKTPLGQPLKYQVAGQVSHRGSPPMALQAGGEVRDIAAALSATAKGNLQQVPVSIIDVWQQPAGRMLATLGQQVDRVDFDVDYSQAQTAFAVNIADDAVTADATGAMAAGQAISVKTATVKYTLTDAALRAWTAAAPAAPAQGQPAPAASPAPAMQLLEPAPVTLTVKDTLLPYLPEAQGGGLNLAAASVHATLGSGRMVLGQQGRPPVAVRDLNVTVEAAKLGEVVQANAQALFEVQGSAAGSAPGKLVSQNRLANLYNAKGDLDANAADIQMDTQLQEVPVDALDALLGLSTMLGLQGRLSEVLGEKMAMTLKANAKPQADGVVDLALQSPFMQMTVPAAISTTSATNGQAAQRVIKLRQDATAQLKVQPGLAKQILAKINPIFINAIEAKEPVKLRVAQSTFWAPLDNFQMGQLNADASLELGTVTMGRGGVLDVLLGLLKAGRGDTSQAVFSPLNVSVKNGVAHYNRFVIDGKPQQRDMLLIIDGLTLGFQGQVNLVTQKLDVETAFYADSLNRLLGNSVQFSANDVLLIPMTGTTSEPKLATDQLYRQIAKLGGSTALRNAVGEEASAVLGGLDAILSAGQRENVNLASASTRRPPGFDAPVSPASTAAPSEPTRTAAPQQDNAAGSGSGSGTGAAGSLLDLLRDQSSGSSDRRSDEQRREDQRREEQRRQERREQQQQSQPQQQQTAPPPQQQQQQQQAPAAQEPQKETRRERRERKQQERQEEKQQQQQQQQPQ